MNLFQKAIYNLKNKKGVSTIEIVIGVLIFIVVLCFMMDLLILMWKFSVIAQTNTEVARIAGIQGGFLNTPPDAYPGGNKNYVTISELESMLNDKFKSAGIASNEWEIRIGGNGGITKNGAKRPVRFDYKETFSVEISVDYRWDFMSNILPGNLRQTITSKRPAMSEWKYNYDNWLGE